MKCVEGCRAGFLMRAEKTPDGGMKGVLMSVTENDLVPYTVKIDANGKEVSREPFPAPSRPEEDAAPVDVAVRAARIAAASATQRAFAATAANQGRGVVNAGPAAARCRLSSPRSIRRSRASRRVQPAPTCRAITTPSRCWSPTTACSRNSTAARWDAAAAAEPLNP